VTQASSFDRWLSDPANKARWDSAIADARGGVTDLEGSGVWATAAQALLDETGVRVRKFRSNMTGISFTHYTEIEAPYPKTARSFAIFAHEIGHQVLHRDNSSYPRWREEVEAWDFALAQFARFGLKGIRKQQRIATRLIAYAFEKAIRRGVDPRLIHRTYPAWSNRVQKMEAA
jgi:hypothetical protein